MEFLKDLNESQREAVQNLRGPLLVIAGPGSGKTRVLTYRIAYMMSQGIDPYNILALTFTNKASREMRERVEKLVGPEARNLWMGTFHSVFARILRIEGHRLGYPAHFSIYDTIDSKSLIKTILKEEQVNDKLYKPGYVFNRISAVKNNLITPEQYANNPDLLAEDEASGRKKMVHLYKTYAERCFKAGAMDFDDLLLKTHQLLARFPDALYKYQNKFKYILIDEFQDTNMAQYEIVRAMGSIHENVCVVGDDAQSIYSFRGANIQNILNFERDYPDVATIRLEQNYRSTANIVAVANEIISNNRHQITKTIWTENDEGQKMKLFKAASDNEEGRKIADNIFEEKVRNHFNNEDFAILYRTNAQSRAFEESLRRLNINYRVYGGVSFYQRKEVKDLLAYLRVIVNPDDEEALKRIINYPARGIGKTTLQKVTISAAEHNKSLWQILTNLKQYGFGGRTLNAVSDFITMIRSFQVLMKKKDAFDVAMEVAKDTGILNELYNDKSVEGVSRYENLQALLNGIKEFTTPGSPPEPENQPQDKSLGAYLQNVSLLTDQDTDETDTDTVKLMTIHAAKGLEFEVVYVVGLEENLFPSMMSIYERQGLEEERRLFYVAVTRAMKKLNFSFATSRFRFGNLQYCEPSRFLDEVPANILDIQGDMRSTQAEIPQTNKSASRLLKPMPNQLKEEYRHTPSSGFMPDDTSGLQVGMEVEHQRFGFGKVITLDGNQNSKIANIHFANVGNKRIMLKYAQLHIVKRRLEDNN